MTDPVAHRKFYVGHASSMPAAAILDPALTVGLPPAVTAATGLDALTHALESYLSVRPNPWSDGIALQVDPDDRGQPAAGLRGRRGPGGPVADAAGRAHGRASAMATTGLGLCHAIGHSLGGRWTSRTAWR